MPAPDDESARARLLRTSSGAIRVERNADTVPKMLAPARATAAVNAQTRQSNEEIQSDLVDRRRQLSHECLAAPLSDDEPADRTEHGENEAVDQQLPRETAAGRAKRQSNTELVPARRGACQQQVGDVDARRPKVQSADFG